MAQQNEDEQLLARLHDIERITKDNAHEFPPPNLRNYM